jgi:acyl carrier protein
MKDAELLERIRAVIRDELDDNSLVVGRATLASDLPGWDSLAHVRIVVGVERALGVRFLMSDIGNLQRVGDLVDLARRAS